MKFKIFLTLWTTFVITLISSSFVYTNFLNSERLDLVDGQIKSYTSILSHSDLIKGDFEELNIAEEQIQEILGGYKIGLVLIIKNIRGKVLYKNTNARNINLDPSTSFQWQLTKHEDNLVRVYTQKLPQQNRILQLGTIVNMQDISTFFFTKNHAAYILAMIIVAAILSWLLTTKLFAPLRKLSEDLNFITKQLKGSSFNSADLDISFHKTKGVVFLKNDEFTKVTQSLQNLLRQIKMAFQINKNHSARLAHEVNTPLSVIKNRLKTLETTKDMNLIKSINKDIDSLASFVIRYLEYSETLNTPAAKTDIFALRLKTFMEQTVESLKPISQGRLKLVGDSQATIFANTHDLEHVIQNIVTNALKYSPSDREVVLNFKEDEIIIQDYGEGIPKNVLDKLGTPFNIGNKNEQKGTGLGLAWVQAIVQKYDWKLNINTDSQGTSVHIKFN